MIYELRIYWAEPGRADDVNARFRDHTRRLFAKHNMGMVGFWTPKPRTDETGDLVYILIHESEEAMAASWAAFRADPEWQKARADSEVNGKIVAKGTSQVLIPTDYSALQ